MSFCREDAMSNIVVWIGPTPSLNIEGAEGGSFTEGSRNASHWKENKKENCYVTFRKPFFSIHFDFSECSTQIDWKYSCLPSNCHDLSWLFAYTPVKYRSGESSEHPSVEEEAKRNSIMSLSPSFTEAALDSYLRPSFHHFEEVSVLFVNLMLKAISSYLSTWRCSRTMPRNYPHQDVFLSTLRADRHRRILTLLMLSLYFMSPSRNKYRPWFSTQPFIGALKSNIWLYCLLSFSKFSLFESCFDSVSSAVGSGTEKE